MTPDVVQSLASMAALPTCGGASTRAARLSAGVRDSATYENFSSSNGTSASFSSMWSRERGSRWAKWHQSGATSGQAASCGQGASTCAPFAISLARSAMMRA